MKKSELKITARMMALLVLVLGALDAVPARAINFPCPECDLLGLDVPAAQAPAQDLMINVAGIVSRQLAPLPEPAKKAATSKVQYWTEGQPLPYAIQSSGPAIPQTSFDPSFVTPYYNSAVGITDYNSPAAPWNLFTSLGANSHRP